MERLLDYFVPDRYVLDIAIDKHQKTIGGKVQIYGEAKAETIKFHAVGLEVDEVTVDGKKHDFEVADGVLTLFKVPRSDLRVEVGYHGSLNENMEGAYISTYEYRGKTEVIVATQFESHYAREAFPCIDEPEAKAVFELIISVPDEDDMILANTPEAKVQLGAFRSAAARDLARLPRGDRPLGRGRPPVDGRERRGPEVNFSSGGKTVSFEPSPRMSTYLLAWVIGKFHGKTITNEHGVEITTYCSLAQNADSVDFANEIAGKSLEFYDDNFGEPYPLKRLIQVALPDFEAGAMENWGLVTYRESMLLVGKEATLATKKSVALTVAHELSHQWFGDLVTMKWWDDLWLNESFASVMEYYAVDYIHPEYKIFEGFFTGDSLSALLRDCLSGVQSVQQDVHDPAEIATLFDPAIVYSKGARLMLMLIRLMGWQEFCAGIKDYFEKYKYKNTVGDDLWECLNKYAEFDVKELMHAFIREPGYPVVTVRQSSRDYTQQRFLLDGEMVESKWPLPEISEDMSGHYVVNLSEADFAERLEKFDKLSLEEKLRLLIDRSLLAKTELVSSASLIPLISKFKDETSASVWSIIVMIVAQLKIFFKYDSKEEKMFKEFVCELVKPGLKKVGLVAHENDDENTLRLRAILIGMDFYAEDEENIKALAKLYNDDIGLINPESRADVLDAKLYTEPEMIDDYLKKYRKIADPEMKFELLFAGTVSKDKKVLDKMIGLLEQLDVVKPQDQFHLFLYLFRNMKIQGEVFDWLVGHWDFVKKMSGDKSLENYPRYTASTIKTSEMGEQWRKFFLPMVDEPGLKRAIEIGDKEIATKLKLIKCDEKAVCETLAEMMK